MYCCWWCCYFSNITSEAINNLLLLQITHIPDSFFGTKLESGHFRPAEDSWKVTSLRFLTGWRVPRSFLQAKNWSDLVVQTSPSEDKTALWAPSASLQRYCTDGFWKALGTYWHSEQTLTYNSRIGKLLTRWI